MNILSLNWIKFFHSTQFQVETMQKLYKYVTELSPNTSISVEEISSNVGVTNEMALNIINSLIESNLFSLKLICPECHENITFSNIQIILCDNCNAEINIYTQPMAIINADASLVYMLKENMDEISYETNAKLIEKIGKERGFLYYLLTDIMDSQIRQEENPDQYSLNLFQLWSDFWPEVMHISRKSSLQLYAKGDAVAWVFNDKEDLLKTINALALYLCENPITKVSVYASKILLPPNIKITFMRSLDKKWDLNSPSVTDFYRRTNFKPKIWDKTNDYVLRYCILNYLEDFIIDNSYSFLNNGEKEDYCIDGKHEYNYIGKCFAGFCNKGIMNINKEPPHA